MYIHIFIYSILLYENRARKGVKGKKGGEKKERGGEKEHII